MRLRQTLLVVLKDEVKKKNRDLDPLVGWDFASFWAENEVERRDSVWKPHADTLFPHKDVCKVKVVHGLAHRDTTSHYRGPAEIQRSRMQREEDARDDSCVDGTSPLSSVNTSLVDDITVLLESSFTLRSAKYLEKKTCFVFHYVRLSSLDVLCPLMVTIVRKVGHARYSGYDSSSYCLVRTAQNMVPGTRYLVYGRIRKTQLYIIDAEKSEPLDYKRLCYSVF
ncbi:UNVERIFIED_CONTAM: hypothetical protein PYX00_011342 [Menopon gallinae]|uniref:Uncharacterized protein n=1 Tax=Menopon gallinae TaxID=328185 RepID=A0AAW2H785_9NEOP